MLAVIDTNVIVSAMLKPDSAPGKVLKAVISGNLTPVIHRNIMEEYNDVLSRKKFNFDCRDVADIIAGITTGAVEYPPLHTDETLPDEDDRIFYEVVLSVRRHSDAQLVTGNKRHFPEKPFVISAREMTELLERQ